MSSATQATSSLNVLSLGGSRNIGYYAALKLLKAGATVTFLLRKPTMFDTDAGIKPYLSSGQVRVVKGDALVKGDVARAWAEAARDRSKVDYLLFTVGGTPKFTAKGFVIDPPNLVTQCLLNALCTLPSSQPQPPRIVVITSAGITPTSHAHLPLLLRPLYTYVIAGPHADKLGAERVLYHLTKGWTWNSSADGEPSPNILPSGWQRTTDGLPEADSLRDVLVVRPSILVDSESLGDKYDSLGDRKKVPYRVSTEKDLGGYTIARKDVAHFIVDAMLKQWDRYGNKKANVSY